MPGRFFDSNTLLYLASQEPDKAARIRAVINEGGVINVQVLNEITNVMRRKFLSPWSRIEKFLLMVSHLLDVQPLTKDINTAGRRIAERYGLAVYDSFIAAAALESGCDTLWSEDMQHGLIIDDKLRITNPFAA